LKNHLTGQTVEIDRKRLETDEKYWVETANTMALFELDNFDFSRTELKDVKSINEWVGKQTEIYSKLLKYVSSAVDKFYKTSIDWQIYKNEHLLIPNTGLIKWDLRILEQYVSEGSQST